MLRLKLERQNLPVQVDGAPCHVGLSNCQTFLGIANYAGGSIEVFRLDGRDKRIAFPVSYMQHTGQQKYISTIYT